MTEAATAQVVVFAGPRVVRTELRPVRAPGPGEVQVRAVCSAISAGTELLAYRGELPASLPLDPALPALEGSFTFPFTYGYAAAGRVEALGAGVPPDWLGRPVFAFQPHASRFVAPVASLLPIPAGLSFEQAVLLPTAETAVGLVHDALPVLGERALVLGQGMVGLLVSALLTRFPLERRVAVDHRPERREAALALGMDAVLGEEASPGALIAALGGDGADLAFELTGVPEALNTAIASVGLEGRVVVGSWYGARRASLDLGGHFHRGRVRLISAQVTHLAPGLSGRWSKARRFAWAFAVLRELQAERWISARLPVAQANEAYVRLDEARGELQTILTYE